MLGALLAIVVVTGTITFGASLRTLVSHPALYGWNWNDEILTKGGGGDIPLPTARALLDHDHDVAAWSGVYFDSLRIDGQTVPIIGTQPGASVQPPLRRGHGLDATNQIVVGGTTLAALAQAPGRHGRGELRRLVTHPTAHRRASRQCPPSARQNSCTCRWESAR